MLTQNNVESSAPEAAPFAKVLISIIRAEDSYGAWDKKSDAALLKDFVITKAERREIPIIGDPDPDTIHRVEQFYRAVGLRIEQKTTLMASPTVSLHHEGFGKVFLTVGKLVAFVKGLRDVHRFGFDSIDALNLAGEKAVSQAVANIEQFPEVANA